MSLILWRLFVFLWMDMLYHMHYMTYESYFATLNTYAESFSATSQLQMSLVHLIPLCCLFCLLKIILLIYMIIYVLIYDIDTIISFLFKLLQRLTHVKMNYFAQTLQTKQGYNYYLNKYK